MLPLVNSKFLISHNLPTFSYPPPLRSRTTILALMGGRGWNSAFPTVLRTLRWGYEYVEGIIFLSGRNSEVFSIPITKEKHRRDHMRRREDWLLFRGGRTK